MLSRFLIAFCLATLSACASEGVKLDLAGEWKAYVQANPEDAQPGELPVWDGPPTAPAFIQKDFDDSNWETVQVPGDLDKPEVEKKGGYFWYRKTLHIQEDLQGRLSLNLGVIADADEVYWDGQLIGRTGLFPPKKDQGYHLRRAYALSPEQVGEGGHLLAIRGYRQGGPAAGILGPNVQIQSTQGARKVNEAYHFFRTDFLLMSSFFVFLIALWNLFSGFLVYQKPQFQSLTFVGLFVPVYVMAASHHFRVLLNLGWWNEKMGIVAAIFSIHFMFRFIRTAGREKYAWPDGLSLLVAVGFSTAILFQPTIARITSVYETWFPVLVLTLLYVGWKLFLHFRSKNLSAGWTMMVGFFCLVGGVAHDIYILLENIKGVLLNPYGFLLFTIGTAHFLQKDRSGYLADQRKAKTLEAQDSPKTKPELDALSGLATRNAFDQILSKELTLAKAKGTNLYLLVIEVDRFDELLLGHKRLQADDVLKQVGWIIQELLTENHKGFRFDRETFVVLARELSEEEAIAWARKLRSYVEAFPVEIEGETELEVTVSVGIASFSSENASSEELIEKAFATLTRAKTVENTVVAESFRKRRVPSTPAAPEKPLLRLVKK